jgi:hypothetical protein
MAYINLRIVDLERMDILVILVNLVWKDAVNNGVRRWESRESIPASTPTTDVNRSASVELPVVAERAEEPGLPLEPSSFFLSASLVPGMTRFPFTGALAVVNVVDLMLLSVCVVIRRASRMTLSFRRSWSVSGWLDSTKYLLCFKTSFTLP